MRFIAWALLSLFMVVVIDNLLFREGWRGWRRFVGAAMLFYGQVVALEFLLGLAGALTDVTLAIAEILLSTGVLVFTRRKYGQGYVRGYGRDMWGAIKRWPLSIKIDPWFVALVVLSVVTLLWIVFLGIIFPVTDIDGNAYHMTYIAQVMQSHSIFDAPTSITWLAGYPKGGELIQLWNVILPRSDMLADLAQLPFLLIAMVSAYGVARRFGVNNNSARFASVLILFLPIVLNQIKTTYVDVIFVGLFFAGLAIATQKRLMRLDYLVLGVTLSLLLSIKSTGLLFVFVCLIFVSTHFITMRNKKPQLIRGDMPMQLMLLMLPMIFGVYWYAKDYIVYGSALYPFGLKVFGISIFPGQSFQEFISNAFTNFSILPHGFFQKIWFVWTERKDWFGCLYNYDATFSGLGPVWFVLLLPAGVVGAIVALKRRSIGLTMLILALVALFLLYPVDFYTRYTIFIVLIGIIGLGLIMTFVGGAVRGFAKATAFTLALIVLATTFTLCNFTPAAIKDQIISIQSGNARGSITYHSAVDGAYNFVQSTSRSGEVVAYDSMPYLIYPLWRPDLSNRVIFIPAANNGAWQSGLKTKHVHLVFTNLRSKEHSWARRDVQLKSVFKDERFEVYEVR